MIAHELAHVANRDAAVMTVVGRPGEALLVRRRAGGQPGLVAARARRRRPRSLIGWLGTVGGRALSRYREFAADAAAVRMTGNPAALASALMKVSEGLVAIPQKDLRAAAVGDAFHLLPARDGAAVHAAGARIRRSKPASPGSSASNATLQHG